MNNSNDNRDEGQGEDFSEELKASVSALVDGELSRSESAFLLKRMEHDGALRSLWLRYQDAGDCMRGQSDVLRQHDFSSKVMAQLDSAALNGADELPNFSANLPQAAASSAPRRFKRAVRYLTAAAMAATVAAVSLSLPSFYTQPATPAIGFVSESAGARAAQTLPVTVASAGVSAQPVSNRLSSGGIFLGQTGSAPMAIDEFLQEHNQGFGGRSAIAPMVYSVSEADVGYLVPSTWETAASAP